MAGILLAASMLVGLTACASRPTGGDDDQQAAADALAQSAWAAASSGSAGPAAAWSHQTFPGKRASAYRHVRKDGRDAVMVHAVGSASMVRQTLKVPPAQLGRVQFSWLVPSLIDSADMEKRDADDSPVRIVLAFDGDRSKFSAKDAMLSELAEALTGEPMPYATLMYVWCNRRDSGSVIVNPRTSRIRKLVLESGGHKLSRWLDYERDVHADYVKVFGEAPGTLRAIAIMTDTDNTGSQARAWYGPVRHLPAKAGR